MSAEGPSRAEQAGLQVDAILAAAQEAADEIRGEARAEAERIEAEAHARARAIREEAESMLAQARREAIQLAEESRAEASGRVRAAARANEEMLTDARAVSAGLRHLGSALTDHAERILSEVQAAHRRISSDLRVFQVEERPEQVPEFEVPRWVERDG